MDKFIDSVVYLIPIAIFIITGLAGKSSKQSKSSTQPGSNAGSLPLIEMAEMLMGENGHADSHNRKQQLDMQQPPVPKKHKNPAKPTMERTIESPLFAEGERSIVPDLDEKEKNEKETSQLPGFDARTAIIHSTIIERKYC